MKNSSGQLCLYCNRPATKGVSLIMRSAPARTGALARFEKAGDVVWVCEEHVRLLAVFIWSDRRPDHQPADIPRAD